MSNNIQKSSLEQAKADYEEIRRFAQEQIETRLQEEVDKKISQVINEEINISIDEEGNIDVTKDGEEIASLNTSEEGDLQDFDDEDFIEVSDDDEPIMMSDENEENDNILDMNMKNEAESPVPAPMPTPTPAPTPVAAPVSNDDIAPELNPENEISPENEEAPSEIDELVSKMDMLINVLMQQQGISLDQQGGEQEFETIDDEQAQAPVAELPTEEPVAELPVQEELTFEIDDFEEGHDILEIIDEETFEDEETPSNPEDYTKQPGYVHEDDTITIVDEDEFLEGDELEEMLGVGQNLRHSNRLGKMPRMGVENREEINENKKIKAQYESKVGELKQENKGLKSELNNLQLERKEFEDAFIQLREQFDEMQTFNGKLALVNKLLMNGGLSFEQKLTVCEQFDGAHTIEEAEKIYKSIIKENNIKVGDASLKIKASTTHTAKSTAEAKPLYESKEAKRMKELAGMTNSSEN